MIYRVTTSGNEWQWVVQQVTKSDNEWQRVAILREPWIGSWRGAIELRAEASPDDHDITEKKTPI